MKTVPLTTGLGEIMEPGTLMVVLVLSPDGTVTSDSGALHGRSQLESSLQFVQKREQIHDPQVYRLIWIAVEIDPAQAPICYKGIAASELLVDTKKALGYKSLADSVNRMSEAMRGGANLKTLDPNGRTLVRQQLMSLGSEVWERSSQLFREALT